FQLLIFAVAGLPHCKRNLHEFADGSESQFPESRFNLDTFHTVIVVNVLQFVSENECQLVFTIHEIEQALAYEYVAAGEGESVHHGPIRDEMKLVGQAPVSVGRGASADLGDIIGQCLLLRTEFLLVTRISRGELVPDFDFFFIRGPREMHRSAGQIALYIRRYLQHGIRRDRTALAALAIVKGGQSHSENHKEDSGALHKNWRMVSRYLL